MQPHHCLAYSLVPVHGLLTPSQGCIEQRKDANRNQCTCSPEKNKNNYVQNGTKACFKQPLFYYQNVCASSKLPITVSRTYKTIVKSFISALTALPEKREIRNAQNSTKQVYEQQPFPL